MTGLTILLLWESQDMPDSLNISIAVLAYNEAENLSSVVRELNGVLRSIPGEHEILIVNDGSTDETGSVAADLARTHSRVRVVEHPKNLGLGGGYRTGFREARKELLTFWAADGQVDPDVIRQFASVMPDYDLVLGYLPNLKRGLLAASMSAGEKLLYRLLFGRLPRFQGALMLRRALLDEIDLVSTGRGWAVIIEFIIKANRRGVRILSVPTDLRERRGGRSKVLNLKTITSNLLQILELRWRI